MTYFLPKSFSTLFFEAGSLIEPGAHGFSKTYLTSKLQGSCLCLPGISNMGTLYQDHRYTWVLEIGTQVLMFEALY